MRPALPLVTENLTRVQEMLSPRIANTPMHRWIMGPGLLNPSAIVRTVKRVIPEAA
jgi:hypothetical protein